MAKRLMIAFACGVFSLVFVTAARADGSNTEPGMMAPAYIVINPLGLLQAGPIVEVEVRTSPDLYVLAHARLDGLGLLSHLLATDTIAFWSPAVGSGVRYFFTQPGSRNAPYIAGVGEIGLTGYSGDEGTSYEYGGYSIYVTLAANAGYRWQFGTFVVNVGGYIGAAPTVYDQWSYASDPSVLYHSELDTTFVLMAEVSIGWALGR